MRNTRLSLLIFLGGFLCITVRGQIPTESDCLGAIPVCDDMYFELNSYEDEGNYENELPADCCVEDEVNSVWYRFVPTISGNLGFEIIPNDLDDDYDWAVFNITSVPCEELINNFDAIVSCNATGGSGSGFNCYGVTGANGGTIYNFQNLNCGVFPPTMDSDGYLPFNELIPVNADDVYVLLIVNFSNSENGYTLDFTVGQDVGISDNIRPTVESVDPIYDGCEIIGFDFVLSEPVFCSSIDASDITIFGPGGPYSISFNSSDCDNLQFGSVFSTSVSPTLSTMGTYMIAFNEDPIDPCSNPLIQSSFEVQLSSGVEQILVLDTVICGGFDSTINLDASEDNANTYLWSNTATTSSIDINQPGTYVATILTDCREIEKTFIIDTSVYPQIVAFSQQNISCDLVGEISILNVEGNGPFEYGIANFPYSLNSTFQINFPGFYTVFVRDVFGCVTMQEFSITEQIATAQVSLSSSFDITFGDTIEISSLITGTYDSLYWTASTESVDCSFCTDITVSPLVTTTYTIFVVDENGCVTSASTIVRVKSQYEFYAPNIFSPNNDGVNDYFTLYGGRQLESLLLLVVYNRWGEKIYEGIDLVPGDFQSGWDGNFKGQPTGPSVYIWMARLRYLDGTERVESGAITLIR